MAAALPSKAATTVVEPAAASASASVGPWQLSTQLMFSSVVRDIAFVGAAADAASGSGDAKTSAVQTIAVADDRGSVTVCTRPAYDGKSANSPAATATAATAAATTAAAPATAGVSATAWTKVAPAGALGQGKKLHPMILVAQHLYGSVVATAGNDKACKLVDTATGATVGVLSGGHTKPIGAVALSGDGKSVFTGGWDGAVRVWDGATHKPIDEYPDHSADGKTVYHTHATCVLPLRDGANTVVTASANKAIVIWSGSGAAKRVVKHIADAHDHAIRELLPHARGFVSVGNDGYLRVWSPAGERLLAIPTHAANTVKETFIHSACVLTTGEFVAVGEDFTARVWSADGSAQLQVIAHGSSIRSVVALPAGEFATGCEDRYLRVFTRDSARVGSAALHDEFRRVGLRQDFTAREEDLATDPVTGKSVQRAFDVQSRAGNWSHRFALDDLEKAAAYFDAHGYVVVGGVADPAQVAHAHDLLWAWLTRASAGTVKRYDPRTWADWRVGLPNNGIMPGLGIGQSDFQWFVRSLPALKRVFERLWGGDSQLMVSFDGAGAFRPWNYDAKWKTHSGWYHTDQNPTAKPGQQCIQALLSLTDQDQSTGGLTVLPGTNRLQHMLNHSYLHDPDYVQLPAGHPLLNREAVLVDAKAGDLVLWDSRTVHCNSPALTAKHKPTSGGGSGSDEKWDLLRVVSYVCMSPLRLCANPQAVVAARLECFAKQQTCNHWPHECHSNGDEPAPNWGGVAGGARKVVTPVPTPLQLALITGDWTKMTPAEAAAAAAAATAVPKTATTETTASASSAAPSSASAAAKK